MKAALNNGAFLLVTLEIHAFSRPLFMVTFIKYDEHNYKEFNRKQLLLVIDER